MSASITKSTSDRAHRDAIVLITAVVTAVVFEIFFAGPAFWALGFAVGAVLGVPVERVWRRIAARGHR